MNLNERPMEINNNVEVVSDRSSCISSGVLSEDLSYESPEDEQPRAAPASTPTTRGQFRIFDPLTTDEEEDESMNVIARPLSRRPFRIDDTAEKGDSFTLTSSQMAANTTLTRRWRERPLDPLKFVDDFMGIEKINAELGYAMLSTQKPSLILHATKCEEFFMKVKAKAECLACV